MRIREAVEADAERLSAIADTPTDVMRNLVHDRTVRVAEAEDGDADPNDDAAGAEDGPGSGDDVPDPREDRELFGFVSFDARDGTVHVTQADGTPEAIERLLSEPVRFASAEGMDVELLVPDGEDDVRTAAETVGFESVGRGPRFDGEPTTRYRLRP